MIDWWSMAANALWILGAAVQVATWAFHDWIARATRSTRRDIFARRSFRVPMNAGMSATCLGWGLAQAGHTWARWVWLALALICAIQAVSWTRTVHGPSKSLE
jgi:hypothetical protein